METIALKCLLARSKVRLGVTSEAGRAGLAKQVDRVRGLRCLIDDNIFLTFLPTTLLVIAPAHRERRRKLLESLQAARLPCLALAGVDEIPDFLIRFAERTSTFVFASRFDENLLTSRLSGLLREKLHRRLFVQGALVNVCGRGVLITGDSGVGKTTLALELARRGHKWIADDAVEIEKRRDGRLTGRSQAMVKNLLEIKEIGVLSVRDLLPAASIANETPIDMVAQIGRDHESKPYGGRPVSIIMGVRLPLLKIPCSNDYDKQLENAARVINQPR
jgi:HPr kinase/phosphorylase